jgi:glycosyltransferase involved in cell wall biosynthesis
MMALSYGRPVIASDLPANREIINDERLGLLFEAGKALSLTEVLRRYLLCATPPSNSVTICSNRSEIRAILTQRFSWKDTAQGINQVIRQHAEIS